VVDGVDHRERGLALAQIAGHGLAQNLFGSRQVEHVVDNLEGQADSAAIGGQARLLGLGGSGQHRAQAHGNREEAGRLAEDQVVVLGLADGAAQLLNLQQLALDHLLGEADEQVEHAQVLLFQRHLEGLHVEPVAGQHAFFVAPGGVGRGPAAAVSAPSMMSSWTSVAVWTISTTAPRRMAPWPK
jgi:hypothetical protein